MKSLDKDFLRYCEDIGMFAWDRPIHDVFDFKGKLLAAGSCIHKTIWCAVECYNEKLYKVYPNMTPKDVRNEKNWQKVTGKGIAFLLSRKRKLVERVRGCTRGENIKDLKDIERWADIGKENPDVLFWVPVRGWRDPFLKQEIERVLFPIKNLAILASLDPTNTDEEWKELIASGWSTMFAGDDDRKTNPLGEPLFNCPKTGVFMKKRSDSEKIKAWKKKNKGHCGICKGGCFSRCLLNRRVDVKLYVH